MFKKLEVDDSEVVRISNKKLTKKLKKSKNQKLLSFII